MLARPVSLACWGNKRVTLLVPSAHARFRHLAHERQRKGFKFLAEMFTAPFPRRRDPIDLSAAAAPASRQRTHNHALLVEHVEVAPLHRFDMVMATHRLTAFGTLLRPKRFGLANTDYKSVLVCFIFGAHNLPTRPKSQQLLKRLFRCHFLTPEYHQPSGYFPLKTSRNRNP
jgi:hypothetical protein